MFQVDVTLQDGRTFEGTVLNADFHSDIAIVKINSKTPLPAAKLGTSSKLCPGDWVVAMGCPHYLQNTVTAGIVRYYMLILVQNMLFVLQWEKYGILASAGFSKIALNLYLL